jgi:hypothetical protein
VFLVPVDSPSLIFNIPLTKFLTLLPTIEYQIEDVDLMSRLLKHANHNAVLNLSFMGSSSGRNREIRDKSNSLALIPNNESKGAKGGNDSKGAKGAKGGNDSKGAKGAKGGNDSKGAKGANGGNDSKGAKGGNDSKGAKGANGGNNGKGAKGAKGGNNSKGFDDEKSGNDGKGAKLAKGGNDGMGVNDGKKGASPLTPNVSEVCGKFIKNIYNNMSDYDACSLVSAFSCAGGAGM